MHNWKASLVNQQKTEQTDDKLMQTQVLTLQRYSTYLRVNDTIKYKKTMS